MFECGLFHDENGYLQMYANQTNDRKLVEKGRSDMIHARIQEYSSGGKGGGGLGGEVQVHLAYKKSSDNVFYFYFSFVLNIFYRSPVVTFKENYHLPRFQWGWNIFQGGGGSNFLQGGPIAFSL